MTQSSNKPPIVHLVADTGRGRGQPPRYEAWMDQLQRHGDPMPVRRQRKFSPVLPGGAAIIAFPDCETGGAT